MMGPRLSGHMRKLGPQRSAVLWHLLPLREPDVGGLGTSALPPSPVTLLLSGYGSQLQL